jgi:uncharacterized protein
MNKEGLNKKVIELFDYKHHVAHDIKHVIRVAALARYIAAHEGYDAEEAEVAAMLHDIGRTLQDGDKDHGPAGVPNARELLNEYTNYDDVVKERILAAVRDHSSLNTTGELTHIVQDADMLDGLGAIGIMRAYTAKADLPDYDPDDIVPTVGRRGTNIHDHIAFQMKWLDYIHTNTAKRIAIKRHAYMMEFLEEFRDEALARDL